MSNDMDDADKQALARLNTEVALLKGAVATLSEGMGELKTMISEIRSPRPTNWVGIVSLGLSAVAIVGGFFWLFLNLRLSPIDKDLTAVNKDVVNLAAKVDNHAQRVQRDLEWNFENQRLHHEHTEKIQDRLWDRVFNGDAPKYTDKPKP